MTTSIYLDHTHYAAKWPVPGEGEFNDLSVVNQAGIDYANLPDGPAKEEKLLEIVKYFHGYVFKYVDLIARGHLPTHNYNGDTRRFLKYFLPKSENPDKNAFAKAAKHLHLAFPEQTPTDIYDILNILLLRCVKKYDPNYVVKVRDLVKIISRLTKKKYFTVETIAKKVVFDPTGAIRLLARKGYITAVRGKQKKLVGYKATKSWPPSKEFLSSGPVGFVYVVQTWFRYYLQEHIDDQMKTIEARAHDKMLQLEHRTSHGEELSYSGDLPSMEGELIDAKGQSWAADTTLMNQSMDISAMTPAWVQHTTDKLFAKMTIRERKILYLIYVQEMSWKQIANTLGLSISQVQKIHTDTLTYLQGKFSV